MIINIEPEKREGSLLDLSNLYSLFIKLDFDVTTGDEYKQVRQSNESIDRITPSWCLFV